MNFERKKRTTTTEHTATTRSAVIFLLLLGYVKQTLWYFNTITRNYDLINIEHKPTKSFENMIEEFENENDTHEGWKTEEKALFSHIDHIYAGSVAIPLTWNKTQSFMLQFSLAQ